MTELCSNRILLAVQLKHFDKKIRHIKSFLAEAMSIDRWAASRELERLTATKVKKLPADRLRGRLERLERRLRTSRRRRIGRQKNVPSISDVDSLPITAKKSDIIKAIKQHPVVIVSGETGSGKTTQLPKYCLSAGRGIAGVIGHTQPRRIAAMTVARRIAEEFGQDLGDAVGYKIRFKDRTSKKAYVKIMTDGILLAETQTDRYLNAYDTIIVDEAHERSLNIDFILGILQTLLVRRDDLKLIITSATIDTEKFSKAFGDAPVIEVSGRMYPVEVRYEKPESKKADKNELTHVERAAKAVRQLVTQSSRGDILVFMPTEQDIRETCELIEGAKSKNSRILPLYARLTAAEQARVFAHSPERKIIVATNVAETSVTIPGIKYVVDSGLARISSYSPRTRTTSLPVAPISRSSADQRKGRCGRVQNGICVRLFAETDYRSRPLYTRPEILRANLAEVILRMMALRLGDIDDFPFIDRPDLKSIKDGYDLLYELGAIRYRRQSKDERSEPKAIKGVSARAVELTEKGRLMARIPLDPRLARMLLEAKDRGCIDQIAVLAAALSIQDPRERPLEKTAEADQAHAQFDDPISDFTTLLNIWNRYNHVWQTRKGANALKHFCRQNFLSYNRMREWRDIHYQIRTILEEFGIAKRARIVEAPAQNLNLDREQALYQAIHQSILSGYLSNIAEKKEKNVFRATQNREVMVFPGSGLFDRAGRWVVAAEMVETSRLFARTVADIESHWLEELGGDLCRQTYLNPRWQKSQSAVMADEQVSLFGLIIAQRPVPYGPVNPAEATEIFIRSAIVKGDLKRPVAFMKHNQRLIDDIQRLEDRLRRRDLLISEQALFDFYSAKLPGVYSVQLLSKMIKKKGGDQFLRLKKQDLMNYDPDAGELARYPLSTKIKGQRFNYRYHFQPGEDDDGVTIQVPVSLAASVSEEIFDWLVPGLIKEKIETLIKGLPKVYRKKLVPVNETVEIIHRELPRSKQALRSALGEFILQRFGVDIPATAWPIASLPDHLKMRISMIAPDGRVLRSDRDTGILRQATKEAIPADAFEAYRQKWQKTGITCWDFGELPEFISSPPESQPKWVAYPALEAGDDPVQSVRLTLFLQQDKALAVHRQGVAGLFKIRFAKDLKILKKGLKLPGQVKAAADYFGGSLRIGEHLMDRVVSDLFCKNIRSQNAFDAHAESVSPILISYGQKLLASCLTVLKAYHSLRKELDALKRAHLANTAVHHFCEDLLSSLDRLVPDSFIHLYDVERLAHIERYIHAMQIRARRALLDFEKDQTKDKRVKAVADRLDKLLQSLAGNTTAEKRKALEDLFWMTEEYKVSVFAQELKTAFPVSKKRLEKKLAEVKRMI
ncbi:MAG: ATP-dependent RNA helicase HrpA [Desulfobacterales bacterium]